MTPFGLEIVEQQPHAFEVFSACKSSEEIGMAAHDQLAVVAFTAGPARDPRGNHLLRQLVELGAVLRQGGKELSRAPPVRPRSAH